MMGQDFFADTGTSKYTANFADHLNTFFSAFSPKAPKLISQLKF